MENLPESLADEFQNYEVTVEDGHLTLIVSTTDGSLNTYTFATDTDGTIHLQSQTENGAKADGALPDAVVELFEAHPVVDPADIVDE